MSWRDALLEERFRLVADMNGDGAVTISDVGLWIKYVYFAPGDALIIWMLDTRLGNFLELTPESLGGWLSGIVSFWALIIVSVAISEMASSANSGR